MPSSNFLLDIQFNPFALAKCVNTWPCVGGLFHVQGRLSEGLDL
jgi:hypothetical protein